MGRPPSKPTADQAFLLLQWGDDLSYVEIIEELDRRLTRVGEACDQRAASAKAAREREEHLRAYCGKLERAIVALSRELPYDTFAHFMVNGAENIEW